MSSSLLTAASLLPLFATALQLFPTDSISSFPAACGSVLSQNITACNNLVQAFDTSTDYQQADLEQACTASCSSALSGWYTQASSVCSNVTYTDDYGYTQSITSFIGELSYNFNQTCLMNNGQYCNVVIGNLTASNATGSSLCNQCILLKLQGEAQSPYDDGPLVYSQSVYQSYTSSCGFTGKPLTASPPPQTLAATTTDSASGSVSSVASASASATAGACTGSNYTIKSGDTCNSIASSQGTATWYLLLDNSLPAYCANFPTSSSLCISHPCKSYTVQSGDSCDSVASGNDITVTQLQSYNPWIDAGCWNFNNTVGTQICLNEPGPKYIAPSSAVGSPSVATAAVPTPTNIAANTTNDCGAYYEVQPGDTCDLIIVSYSISLSDFLILNPAVNTNCTNLYAYESYCMEPVGSINDYPGSPFYGGNTTNTTVVPWSSLPNATYTPIIPINTLPLAAGSSGTPLSNTTCYQYSNGETMIYNYSGVSDCSVACNVWNITLSQLQSWNPSLSTGSANCTFDPGFQYCVWQPQATFTPTVSTISTTVSVVTGPPPTTSATGTGSGSTTSTASFSSPTSQSSAASASSSTVAVPSPTQANSIAANCNSYAKAVSGDYCTEFASKNGISQSQLYNWNSVLGVNGTNCNNDFWGSTYYCIGVVIPSPTQSNSIPANCDVYAMAPSGSYCSLFASENNITTAELYQWNSVLGTNGANCNNDFWADTYYCTGVNGQLSTD